MTAYVVMGVSGSGKTVVGQALARSIGAQFIDGDDLHPPANVARMASGLSLRDEDRWPWLDLVAGALGHPPVVVACSALKRVYRDRIRAKAPDTVFLHLDGSREVIAARMAERKDHFMPMTLLDSQFAALEPPGPDEVAVTVRIDQTVDGVVADLRAAIGR